jgi:CRISPR-associated protein Cmr2
MTEPKYTVITFAPVQGFIEKSRKLRDLYGSSYILSLLSWVICQSVEKQGYKIVSPALPNITQGMPNQIVVEGEVTRKQINEVKDTFTNAWKAIVDSCKEWIEQNLTQWDYAYWRRDWQLWVNYCWEFFWASGDTITKARENLNQQKNRRDWTGINWQGESSTLSGSDAIASPNLGKPTDPRNYNYQDETKTIRLFYQELSKKLGEAFIDLIIKKSGQKSIDFLMKRYQVKSVEELSKIFGEPFIEPTEELSIPELVKRMITSETIISQVTPKLDQLDLNLSADKIKELSEELNPKTFKDLNRHKEQENEEKYWTGWFLGDGDNASKYFQALAKKSPEEEQKGLTNFSETMREWGKDLKENQQDYLDNKGRMIYAGGDDFLGVLYDGANHPTDNQAKIAPLDCLSWFYNFKSNIWHGDTPKVITCSVGFVWAGNQVPQRDILQHCHEAEQSAKSTGRDRIAFRILFNSGNYLEWVCPWWLLDTGEWIFTENKSTEKSSSYLEFFQELKQHLQRLQIGQLNLIESYQDRNNIILEKGGNWTHFYQDVAILESRHAFVKRNFSEEELNQGNIEINNDIALGLIEIYFGQTWHDIIANYDNWFNKYDENELLTFSGILGDPKQFDSNYEENPDSRKQLASNPKVKQALNNWVINLAKIGFYLTDKGKD